MTTFGYLFILAGILAMRQVVTGRVKETPSDIRDLTTAFLNADVEGMKTVLTARGDNVTAGADTVVAGEVPAVTPGDLPANSVLAREVVKLGSTAKGYVFGASGPVYYDCSGLIWKAARNVGAYKGPRFTTSTFTAIAPSWCVKVNALSGNTNANVAEATASSGGPKVGDIVLWKGHHMGVMTGPDEMYSARSPSRGIGVSSISGDSSYFGSQPEYWRVK